MLLRNSRLAGLCFCYGEGPAQRVFFVGKSMGEKMLHNSNTAVNFRSGWAGFTAEKLGFRPQNETLHSFMAGKGRPEDNQLQMNVNGRTEFWHRNEPGFADGQVRVVSIGAHPDDTALSAGLEHILVKKGKENGKKNTRLAVISATPGQANGDPSVRINEDVLGTKALDADVYVNLGFSDGNIAREFDEVYLRLSQYLRELRPHIVILPDPDDLSHLDHVGISLAATAALQDNHMSPLVLYTDHQFGDNEIGDGSFGFSLHSGEKGVVETAFLKHSSQTATLSADVVRVMSRPDARAQQFYPGDPDIEYLGIGRQNLDPRFSQEPISFYLGSSHVPLRPVETIVFQI